MLKQVHALKMVVGLIGLLALFIGWNNISIRKLSGSTLNDTKAHVSVKKKTANMAIVVNNTEIDTYLNNLHFSGTALIVRRNQTVLQRAYGETDRQTHQLNQVKTTYYIGSAEKALIATAILQLQDQGKLKITDPIGNYLPSFPNGQRIKLTDLLHHTSGLKGHTEQNRVVTPRELVMDIEKRGVIRQPGHWRYLDSNYTVLAYLVEKITGKSLNAYLTQHIITPAGMQSTGTYQDFRKTPSSVGYFVHNGLFQTPKLPHLSQLFGVGNMYMTAADMYRFDHALMQAKLISNSARREMFTVGSSSTYGMGFYIDPGSYTSHGVLDGWNMINSFTHTGKTYIILMSNVQNNIASLGKVTSRIYQILNQSTH